MNYNTYLEKWNDLDNTDKINCYNEFVTEHTYDEELFVFDEEFFNLFFDNPLDAVRAAFFGNIKNWSDEYIKFNGYGNLVSLSEYEAASLANDYADQIFEYSDIWMRYIEDEE